MEEKLFKRNKWFYSVPGIGRDMAYTLFTTYLLTFVMFTRNITVEQFAVLGTILVIFRIWDALNDPIMGGIVENTKSKVGKFKPWILIGAVLNAVVLVVMFTNRLGGWNFVILFGILYLIWDVTWTMNDIAYWSMLPSLTSKPKERDDITSKANLFASIGTIIATGLIPILTNGSNAIGGNSITGYIAVSVFIACALVVSQTVVFIGVKEKKNSSREKGEHVGLKKMFSVIFKNDQLLWVTLIMLLYNLGSALLTAFGVNYMYLSFGYNGFYVTLFVAFFAASTVAVNVIYPALASKFSRRKLSTAGLIVTVIGYILFFVIGTVLPAANAPKIIQLAALCIEAFIIGFGQALFYLVTTLCLTNTIEYNEYKTGSRDEAIIFSLRPFMAKMGSALQQLIITIVYLAIGMTTLTNGISDIEQQANMGLIDEAAKNASIAELLAGAPSTMTLLLRICMAFLPIILISGAYIVMRLKVKLDEETYDKMLKEIESKRSENHETVSTSADV